MDLRIHAAGLIYVYYLFLTKYHRLQTSCPVECFFIIYHSSDIIAYFWVFKALSLEAPLLIPISVLMTTLVIYSEELK